MVQNSKSTKVTQTKTRDRRNLFLKNGRAWIWMQADAAPMLLIMDGTAELSSQGFSSVLLTEKLEITFSSIKTNKSTLISEREVHTCILLAWTNKEEQLQVVSIVPVTEIWRHQTLLIVRKHDVLILAALVHHVMPIKTRELKAEIDSWMWLASISISEESVSKTEEETGPLGGGRLAPGRKEGPLASLPMSN